ncbi:uncharacterized protein CBL_13015 [Carabus blaptoides fortunei]
MDFTNISSSELDDQVELLRSNKGGAKIIHKGYMYTVHKKKYNRIRWRCSQRTLHCKGSITTGCGTPIINLAHNHVPDTHAVALARCRGILVTEPYPPGHIPVDETSQPNEPEIVMVDTDHNLESVQNPLQSSQSVLKSRNVASPSSSGPPESSLGPDAEVCLRWNSYHSNMQTVFPTLMTNEKYVDVTLFAEGKSLKCHKLILSSCSPYFEEILSNSNPQQQTVIVLRGFAYWQVKALIDFMYKGEVNIDQSKLDDLLKAGSDLQIKGLAKEEKNPIETEEFDLPNDNLRDNEIKNEEPLGEDDDDDEDYFPNPEYKKKTAVKPKRKRKISSPPDPSLLKQVKINLKGTKSRPNIKQPKYYSPDYPEYDPDRCVSPPKLGSDPVFHIDNIKLEPIDMDVAKSPDFLEIDSLMNDSQLADNSGNDSMSITPKSRARIVKAKMTKMDKKNDPESSDSFMESRNISLEILNQVVETSKSLDSTTCDSAVPSTSKGITDPLTTNKKVIIEAGPHKKSIIVKCPKRNSDDSFILSQLSDPSNKTEADKPKPQIRVRNLATTETMLKKFATTQLTSILKKGEPINQPVICQKVGGLTRLLKAPAQTPPVTVEPDLVKYALVPPEEPEPKSEDEEMGEIETLDDVEYTDTLADDADDEDYKIDLNLILPH